jgi:hypothetical protein
MIPQAMNTTLLKTRILLLTIAFFSSCGFGRAASVTISLPRLDAGEDSPIQVAVSARQAEGLGPLQMDLVFDPKVLEFIEVSEGKGQPIGLFDWNLVEPGRLRLAMTGDPGKPIQGDNELFLLTFRTAKAAGQESKLLPEAVTAWEQTPESHEMRVTAEAGSISITGKGSSLWLIGTISGCFLAILIVSFLIMRSRRGKQGTRIPATTATSAGDRDTSSF